MQLPPAAAVQVVRSRRLGGLLLSLSLLSVLPVWFVHTGGQGLSAEMAWALVAFWGLITSLAAVYWLRMPQGPLRWDGEAWYWGKESLPVYRVALQFDFQQSLWVWVQPLGRPAFGVWLDADPVRMLQWRALRRALVATAMAQSMALHKGRAAHGVLP